MHGSPFFTAQGCTPCSEPSCLCSICRPSHPSPLPASAVVHVNLNHELIGFGSQGLTSDPFEEGRRQHHLDTPAAKSPMPPSPMTVHQSQPPQLALMPPPAAGYTPMGSQGAAAQSGFGGGTMFGSQFGSPAGGTPANRPNTRSTTAKRRG